MDIVFRELYANKIHSRTNLALVQRLCLEQDMLGCSLVRGQWILLTAMYEMERDRILLVDKWFLLAGLR